MKEQAKWLKVVNDALVAEFVKWETAAVTHVALGPSGFEPITPQQAQRDGRRAYDIHTEQEAIMRNMLERMLKAAQGAQRAAAGAVMGRKGGKA